MNLLQQAMAALIPMLKTFEGCILKAYRDWVGVWTIGYGETLGVREGMSWTQDQADAMLNIRAMQFMLDVLKVCPQLAGEPPTRIAACTSLAYNIGIGAFGVSSACRKTKRKDYAGAASSFALWNKAGGKVSKVLTLRRQREAAVYRK